ncbi:MAG: hypothetical protein LBL20_04850 [Treponema sp.]|nr:hypothetical protein [Treponema sp.]
MNKRIWRLTFAALLVMILIGCASPSPPAEGSFTQKLYKVFQIKSNDDGPAQEAPSAGIGWDWDMPDTITREPFPGWLKELVVNNNDAAIRKELQYLPGTGVVRYSIVENAPGPEDISRQIARELKQYVMAGVPNLTKVQMDMVEQAADAAGEGGRFAEKFRLVGNFVQIGNDTFTEITVYACRDFSLRSLAETYVDEVIGRIPDQAVQIQVARNFDAIVAEAVMRFIERSGTEL